MKDNLNHIDDYLLGKWINDELNEEESIQISEWINSSEENKSIYNDVSKIKNDITQLNLMSAVNSAKGISRLKSRLQENENAVWPRILIYGQKIAAILVLPLLIYTVFSLYNQITDQKEAQIVWQEIYTPVGLRSTYQLPDGTKVTLNGNTHLKFPSEFSKKERLVKLNEEAFFEVVSDKSHPFVVNTKYINVQAVGTQFNVRAFEDDAIIETALLEGKVNLLKETSYGEEHITSLKPSELASFNSESHRLKIMHTNLDKYLAWKDGTLLFQNDSFLEVLKKLGQWYNVKFNIDESIAKVDYAFTGTFHQEGLHQILETIEVTSPIEFTFLKPHQTKDSINNKRTIIVTYKNTN